MSLKGFSLIQAITFMLIVALLATMMLSMMNAFKRQAITNVAQIKIQAFNDSALNFISGQGLSVCDNPSNTVTLLKQILDYPSTGEVTISCETVAADLKLLTLTTTIGTLGDPFFVQDRNQMLVTS